MRPRRPHASTSSPAPGRRGTTKPRSARNATPPERAIAIQGEYITLGQLLKVAGVIGTGGEAKFYLAEIAVQVNGEPEQRRGRKLYPGDLIIAPNHAPVRLTSGEVETDDEES